MLSCVTWSGSRGEEGVWKVLEIVSMVGKKGEYIYGLGGSCEGAKESPWCPGCRCGMLFDIQGMMKSRERFHTLQMCEGGWEKSYESGRTPCWKKSIEVWLVPRISQLVMVWVSNGLFRRFITLLRYFIFYLNIDLCQQCLYCSKMYSSICAFIPHLCRDQKERIVYLSAKQLPEDGCAFEHDSNLLSFVHESHCDPFVHPADDDSSDTEADCENASINPEQPPVRTRIYGTPQIHSRLAGKLNSNVYFDNFDDDIDLWSQWSCEEEYWLAHSRNKHNLRRAAINELVRNSMMATITNLTWSHTLLKRSNKMSYMMGIVSGKSSKVYFNHLADPINHRDNDYTHCFYRNAVECFQFLMQQPVFRKNMSYAPAMKFNDVEERL